MLLVYILLCLLSQNKPVCISPTADQSPLSSTVLSPNLRLHSTGNQFIIYLKMISKISFYSAVASVLTQAVYGIPYSSKQSLRVESFINQGITGFNVVSSLIIGSETAVLIDMPMSIPSANVLASWIRNQTDKPLVAAFATHHHVDHYLGASTLLSHFNETAFYASEKVVDHIRVELPEMVIYTPLAPIPDHVFGSMTE